MNASQKKTVAGAMAALTLAFAVFAAAPASAGPMWWGHHGYGWGPCAAAGVIGLAARRRDRLEQLRLHPLSAGLRPLGQLHRQSSGQRLLLSLDRPYERVGDDFTPARFFCALARNESSVRSKR